MAEWSIAAVLKTVEVRASGGSNPSLSADKGVNHVGYVVYTLCYAWNYCLRNDFKESVLNPKILDLSCNPLSDVSIIGF